MFDFRKQHSQEPDDTPEYVQKKKKDWRYYIPYVLIVHIARPNGR